MSPRPPHNVNPTFSCYLKYHRDIKPNENLSPVLVCYFCLWYLSFWLVRCTLFFSLRCFSPVDLVRVHVCCWGMTFQLCIQWNWQRGSEEGWGVMRGAGVFRGLQTNRYHGEPLLSKPPRSQLLTCSVMGLLNSIQYMDMRISLSFFVLFFFTQVPSLLSVLLLAFLILPFCLFLICLFFCFHVPICVTTPPSFASSFLPYLKLTNCAIMRPVVLLNPLCMARAGSESEHGLFWVIIIQFANTQPLCESGVRGDGMIKYWGRARQLQMLAVMCERMNVMTSMFKHSCGEESLGGLFINTNMSSSPRCRHCWCKHDNNREEWN